MFQRFGSALLKDILEKLYFYSISTTTFPRHPTPSIIMQTRVLFTTTHPVSRITPQTRIGQFKQNHTSVPFHKVSFIFWTGEQRILSNSTFLKRRLRLCRIVLIPSLWTEVSLRKDNFLNLVGMHLLRS